MSQDNTINPLTGLPMDMEISTPSNRSLTTPVSQTAEYKGVDDFASYMKYGVTPTPNSDMDELRAERQSTVEKWRNGIGKFVGKTGTAVLGGTLGSIYGIGSAIANGDMNAFYDNAFQRGMDDINEWLDKKLPNYMTNKEQEEGFLQSLDNANFWANDVLGGLSFTMGAVLTELGLSAVTAASGGAGAGIQGAATANMLSRAKTLLKGVEKAKRGQQIRGATRIGRQFITGAGYEAGVEARHFKDEAMKAFQAANPEASNEEIAKASEFIKTQANWVFAANMALVGSSNAIQFKKIFGDGIKSQASAGFKQGIRQSEGDLLSGKFVESLAGKYEKLRSNLDIALRTVKNPLMEGVVEEGGQSVISGTAKNYLMKGYSPEGVQAAYDLASAFGDALAETYGSKEGWKEIGIGMIIGGMGSPTFRKAPWAQGGWSGGIMEGYEEFQAGKNEQKDLAIRNTEASYDQVRSLIKSNAAQYESNKEKEQALANGDIFSAKTAEADSMFAFMSARHEAGLLGGTVDEFTQYVQDMSTEEFGQEFGYDVTEEELAARKSDVIRSFKDKASDLSSSWSDAKKLRAGEDYSDEVTNDIQRGIAHSIYSMKDLNRRESSMIEELQGVVKNLNPEYLKSYIKYQNSVNTQKGWIKRRSNILKRAEQDFRELVKFSSNYDTPNKDIAKLEKQIADIKRYRTSLRPSETNKIEELDKKLVILQNGIIDVYKDIVAKNAEKKTLVKQVEEAQRRYEALLEQRDQDAAIEQAELSYNAESLNYRLDGFESLEEALKEYSAEVDKVKDAKNPMTAGQIDELMHDLAKLATQREYVVKSYNTLLTKPGQEEIAKMTEDMIRMYESVTRREEIGRALRSTPKQTAVDADTEADLASTETLEGKKALLQDKIDELREQAAIEKFDAEMAAKLGAMEARMDELETETQEQANAKALLEATPYKPIVNRPHHLGQILMFDTDAKTKAMLSTLPYSEILEKGEIRWEPYEGNPGEVRNQDWHKGVTTVKGYGKGEFAAHVYYDGTRIGYLPNPRRFIDTKTKQPLDLNKIENLVKINPAFVTNGKLNEDGASFLAKWNSLVGITDALDNGDTSTISLKKAFYANPQHSVKILRGSESRPEVAEYEDISEYQMRTPLGDGVVIVERDSYNPNKVGERVWFKAEGRTWEKLEGSARNDMAKYVEGLKTTAGKSKLNIQGAGQYALVMNAIYKTDKTPFVYDLGQPTLTDTSNASFDAINQQVSDLDNVDRETGKVLVDEAGRPFFVALSSNRFMGSSYENVRSKITLKKFEDGPKMVLTLQYKGKYYNQTLFTEKTIKNLTLDKMNKRLGQVVQYGFKEIKEDYPDLSFASFKQSIDKTPENVEQMTMNAVPHLELELVGKSYKEQRNKLTGVVPAVKKDYKKEVPKKPSSTFGISELVATKKIYNAAMQITNPTELEALLTEHNDLLEAADSNRDSFKKLGTYIDGITKRYEELTQGQPESINEDPSLPTVVSIDITEAIPEEIIPEPSQEEVDTINKSISEYDEKITTYINQNIDKILKNPKTKIVQYAPNRPYQEIGNIDILFPITEEFYNVTEGIDDYQTYLKKWKSAKELDVANRIGFHQTSGGHPMVTIISQNNTKSFKTSSFIDSNEVDNYIQNRVQKKWAKKLSPTEFKKIYKLKVKSEIEEGVSSMDTSGIEEAQIVNPKEKLEKAPKEVSMPFERSTDPADLEGGFELKLPTKNTKEDTDFQNDMKDLLGDDFSFRIANEFEKATSKEEKMELLSNIIPTDLIAVRDLETIYDSLANNGITMGAFIDNVVYLSQYSGDKTAYHEAFHVVYRSLLTKQRFDDINVSAKGRYGKPSKKALQELRETSNAYRFLNQKELENLWYEEKMADDFMEYAYGRKKIEGANWLVRLFNKIIKLIKGITSRKSDVEGLFSDIYEGKFRNAKTLRSNVIHNKPAFMVIKTRDLNGGKISETGFSVLNKQDTNRIIYKVLNNLINRSARDQGFNPSSGLVIVEEIDNIRNNYYNHKVWIEEAKTYMNQPNLTEDQMQEHKGKLYEKMARIRVINEALDNPENIQNVVKDIQTRLKNYNIFPIDVEHEHDLQEQDYEGNGEDFFGNFDKANYEIGGISSVSQRMKEYIFTTTDSIDEFGFGVDLDNDKYQIPVNGEHIYYGLQRTLVNTDIEKLFNKFYNFAKNNSSTRAFYNKFVNDVAVQSGTDVDSVIKSFEAKELSDLELERYRQAPVFNDFISAFVKDQVDFYSVLYDAESTTARMFSSNRVGADQIQFESWKNNFESLGLTKAQVNQALDTIQELYESPASVAKEADTVTQIQELFGGIGIKLSPTYIQWSLLDYHQDVWRTWNDDRTAEYDNLHSAFTNVAPIHLDLEQLSFNTLRTLNNRSQLETNPSGFFERNVDETTMAVDESTGAQTTLRKIAKSNAKFDETVGDSTFRNAENKQVFDKLNPSFITTIVRRLRESNADLETILTSYKLSPYETDVLRQALTYNKFVNGKHEYEGGIRSSEEFASFVFQNLNIIIADGIREESFNDKGSVESWKQSKGGKTYKNLGAEAQELFKLIMYADNTRVKFQGKDVDLRYFLVGNSEKSTQMFVKAPLIKKVVNSMEIVNGKPKFTFSNVVKESLLDLVRQEHARIQKVLGEIYEIQEGTKTDFISSKYHGKFRDGVLYLKQEGKEVPVTVIQDGDTFKLDQMYEGLPRGLKMFRFSNHPLASMIEQSALLNEELDTRAIKDSFDDYYTAEIGEYIDLALLDSGAVSLADGVYTNELLPKEVFGTDSLDFTALANYFMNQVINVANFNQLLHGDLALSYKNLDDVTKRNGGMIAAGPSLGSGKIKYKTVSSVELPMEEVDIARHGIKQDYIDRTDAQNFGTMSFYRKNYLNSLGKHVQAVKPILDKIERGIDLIVPLTKTELDTLDNHNANLHDRKIVGRSATWYDKTSLHTLTRAETSRISKQFYKAHGNNNKSVIAEINRRYEALESATTPEDIRRAAMDVNAIYVAKPGKLERHTILNDMIFKNYDLYIYDSASKMAKFDVDADVVHEVDAEFLREQVNTDGFKNKIVHGTQMIQLIWSEQDQAATVEWEKTKVKYGELVNKYKSLLADRVRKGAIDLQGTIFQFAPDGNLSQDSYRELFGALRNGLITDDLWVTELFELDSNGLPKYDPNYPAIRLKYEAMYLAFVSNRVFKAKVAGRKYTLVSDVGYEIPRENLGEVTKEEAMQNPYNHIQKGDKYYKVGRTLGQGEVSGGNAIFSRLRHRIKDTDRFGNEIYVSEVVISEKAARTYGLKAGDEIPKALQLQMGIRIPTQDMHSMVTMKVVETLPYYYGNSVMLPYEIVLLSGADFDIDSLFARMYEVHSEDIAYGSYYKAKNPISAAHKEYQASGKDVTLEEFKTIEIEGVLLTDQVNSNVNAFKTGNLSKIKPLTKSEANNLLLDIEMRLMHNSREIAATPASMAPLKDTLADFQNNGIQSKGRTTGVDSPLDNIKAAKALEIGSKGIGVSAVFNTLFQRLAEVETRIDIPLFTDYNSVTGYQTTIAGQDVRKNDVFSAIISAMTDNAKERLASEFNLTLDTLGAAMYMMSTGIPVDEVLYIMRQPVVSSYVKYMNLENMPISNREVEQVPEIDLLDAKNERSLFYTKEALGTTETKFAYEKQDLIDSIIAYEEGGFENLSEEQKSIQAYILKEFTKAKQISEELRAYRAVSALVKGLDSSWHIVDRMDDSLNKLGITVSKKPGTSGLSPDHWKVSQAMTKDENNRLRPANFTGMNYVNIMSQFPVDIENVKAAFAQREGSKYYFILQSPVAQRLKSKLKYNFGASTWDYAENNKQLDDSLISFLITRAFKHKFNPELTLDDLFRIEESGAFEGQNKFHEEIKMLKEKYPDNEFLDKIQLNKSPYTSEYSPYRGKTLHKVEIETNLSSDVTRQEAMIRGFMSIYTKAMENKRLRKESGSPMDNAAVLSIEERVFRNLIGYLIVKDGMLFKNKSFIRAIAPYLVQDAFTSLTSMRNDFAKGQFKDYFGKSEVATFQDFEETYSRWNQTNRGLKYVAKKNVPVKGVKGAYTVKEDNGRITVDVYAGTDPAKGSEVNKKITSTNLKGAYGQLGLGTMGFMPSGYGKSLHLRLPGFIKKNNQVYRLSTRSLKVGKNTLTLDRKGFVIYFPGFDKKRVHLNYLVKAGKIEEKVANTILESNAGYKASYELVTPIGNKDISPFGSTIAEHNVVSAKKVAPKPKKATFLKKVKEGKVSKPAGFEGMIDAINTLQVGSKIKFDMGGQDVTITINKPVRKPKNLTSNFWWNMQTYEGASSLDASVFIQNVYSAIQKPDDFTYEELMSEIKMEIRNPANEIINLKSNC